MKENGAYGLKSCVLQCKGKIGLNERRALESLGISLSQYIPDNAFLVRLSQEQIDAVVKLHFIESVSAAGLEKKLEESLAAGLERLSGEADRQIFRVVVRLFENAHAESIISYVQKAGGKVAGHDSNWLEVELEAGRLFGLAAFPEVLSVEEAKEFELLNDRAGEIIKAPSLWTGGLTGAGQIIGVADTGLDTGVADTMHPDFQDRVTAIFPLGRSGDASDFHGHGTHVAGSALGSGKASEGRYRGVAPESSIVFQSIMDKNGGLSGIPGDLGILLDQAYQAGARIYNISWGSSVRGVYNYTAAQVDKYVWEHDDMALAVAAGNIGQAGAIYSPAVAKNVIAVGASENNRPEKGSVADNPSEVAFFSSRGPAADGRIKPDIVAPGTWILSSKSSLAPDNRFWGVENQYYAYNGGTSMASPIVAGMLGLIREYFTRVRGINPSSALLKAALLDGAFHLPNHSQNEEGKGRLCAPDEFLDPTRSFLYVDRETKLATGEKKTYQYRLNGSGATLKATLVWTDYPAATTALKALVNDLDLTVESPSGKVYALDDHVNNVEQVIIPNADPGVYFITVSGYHIPMGYQGYALFVSGGLAGQPDTTAPVVRITSPQNNSMVEGVITISAEAGDDMGVARVEFYLDSQLIGINTTPPYRVDLDTRPLANKAYNIIVRAFDGAGNAGEDTVAIVVNNPVAAAPEVKIAWPLEGVVLKGVVRFRVNVSSGQPLANASFLVNDRVIKVYDYSKTLAPIKEISPYTILDTTKYPNGFLVLRARACDRNSLCGESSVSVTVSNP
ncbi:MAG: S8 family serine peptidase [Bacillota bacterium]